MENLVKKEINSDVIGTFLNGHNPQERIVNLEYSYRDNFIRVYYRNQNDDKCVSEEPFYPFLWATKDACMRLCGGNRMDVKELLIKYNIGIKKLRTEDNNGNVCNEMANGYMFMFYALEPMSYSKFLDFFKKAKNPVYKDKKDMSIRSKSEERQYITATPQEQYLISTGKRFFKGYDDYDQLLRMIFDLETTGLDTKKDRIEQFGIRFNRPVKYPRSNKTEFFEKVLEVKGDTEEERNKSELECIKTAIKIIYTFRPDIITAHNGENFDWLVIINACLRLGTSIEELCKPYSDFFNGGFIHKNERESILKLGGEIEKFNQTVVPGITVTDSLHAVRRAQATNSNFLQANLKYSTEFLNLKKPNRVYTPGDKISEIWNDYSETYAFNDENGDWYKYDKNAPSQKKYEIEHDLQYFINEYNNEKEDIERNPYDEFGNKREWLDYEYLPEERYNDYVTKINELNSFKPGKSDNGKFIMYVRNYIKEGYELVSGHYIVTRYLLDDLYECDKVEKNLNGADFMLCKFIPVTFQKCCTMGTASQWKAIMMAWSYENDLAIPMGENTGSFTGGLSRLLSVGYKEDVAKFDYNSLYPSIILTWAISDKTDLMGSMLHMLEYVLTTREKYKGLKKKADKICEGFKERIANGEKLTPEEQKEYDEAYKQFQINDNLQMVVKKLGNSFFGSYGSNNGAIFPWKSVACAERTTCTGRQSLRLMIKYFNDIGYEPIVGDTDGFDFGLPKNNYIIEPKKQEFLVLSEDAKDFDVDGNTIVLVRNGKNLINVSIEDIARGKIEESSEILLDCGWVSIKDISFDEV